MPWLYLLLAGLLEIGWAIGLKYTDGFTRWWPSVGTAAAMTASFFPPLVVGQDDRHGHGGLEMVFGKSRLMVAGRCSLRIGRGGGGIQVELLQRAQRFDLVVIA